MPERVVDLSPHPSPKASDAAWQSLRHVPLLPSGMKVPVQVVEGVLDALKLLHDFDPCSFDALVKACRLAEGKEVTWGLSNIPFLLESTGFITKEREPYPIIREVVLLCVKGDNPLEDAALHYPESCPAWEEGDD